jgi:hypothetical protein
MSRKFWLLCDLVARITSALLPRRLTMRVVYRGRGQGPLVLIYHSSTLLRRILNYPRKKLAIRWRFYTEYKVLESTL